MHIWPKCIALVSDKRLNDILKNVPKDRDAFGRSGLFYAVYMRKLWLVEKLIPLEAGMRDVNGMTALMFAASSGFIDAVKLLASIEHSIVDNHGYTALTYAIFHQNYQAAQIILNCQTGCPSTGTKQDIIESLNHSTGNNMSLSQSRSSAKDVPLFIDVPDDSTSVATDDRTCYKVVQSALSLANSNEGALRASGTTTPITVSSSAEDSQIYESTDDDQEEGALEPNLRQTSTTSSISLAQPEEREIPSRIFNLPFMLHSTRLPSLPVANRSFSKSIFSPSKDTITAASSFLDSTIASLLFPNTLFMSPGWKFACLAADLFSSLKSKLIADIIYNRDGDPPLIPIVEIAAGLHMGHLNTASCLNIIALPNSHLTAKKFLRDNAMHFTTLTFSDRETSLKFAFSAICLGPRANVFSNLSPLPLDTQDPIEALTELSNLDLFGIVPEISLSNLIALAHDIFFGNELSSLPQDKCLQYATAIVLGHYPAHRTTCSSDLNYFIKSVMSICPSYPDSKAILEILKPIVMQPHDDHLSAITFLASICTCFKGHRLLWNYALQYFYRTLVKSRDISIPLANLIKHDNPNSKYRARDLFTLLFAPIASHAGKLSQIALHTPIMGFLDILRQIYENSKAEGRQDHPECFSLNEDYSHLIRCILNNTDNDDIALALYRTMLFRNDNLRDIIISHRGRDFRDAKGRTPYMIDSLCASISMSVRIHIDSDGEVRRSKSATKKTLKELYGLVVPFTDLVRLFLSANIASFYCRVLLKAALVNLPLRVVHFFELHSSLDLVAFNRTLFDRCPDYNFLQFAEVDYTAIDSEGVPTLGYMIMQEDRLVRQSNDLVNILTRSSDNSSCRHHSDQNGWTLLMRLSSLKHTFLYVKLFNALSPRLLQAQASFGETALMVAAKANNLLAVTYLLLNGEGRMQTSRGMTALMFAIRQTTPSIDIVGSLLTEECGIQDSDGNTAFMHFCLVASCDINNVLPSILVQELVSKEGALTNKCGMTPLMFLLLGYALKERFANSSILCLQNNPLSSTTPEATDESALSSDTESQQDMTVSRRTLTEVDEGTPTEQSHLRTELVQSQTSSIVNRSYLNQTGTAFNPLPAYTFSSNSLDFIFPESDPSSFVHLSELSDELLDSYDESLSSDASSDISRLAINDFHPAANPFVKNIGTEDTLMSSHTVERELSQKIINMVGSDGYNTILTCFRSSSFGSCNSKRGLADVFMKAPIELKPLSTDLSPFREMLYKSDIYGNKALDYCMGSQYLIDIVLNTTLSQRIPKQSLALMRRGLHRFISRCYRSINLLTQGNNISLQEKDERRMFCYELFEAFFAQFDVTDELVEPVSAHICSRQKHIRKLCESYLYSTHDLNGSTNPNGACVICMSRNKEVCIVPCGHMVYCCKCARANKNKSVQCPLCRKDSVTLITPILLLQSQVSSGLDLKLQKKKYKWLIDEEVYVIDEDST